MPIPLVDLRAQYRDLRKEIDAAIASVVQSARFIKGPAVADFEQAFAEYCEARHAIGVANGTDALRLVLEAMQLGRDDEVLTVPTTFIATTEAISHVGATIRF